MAKIYWYDGVDMPKYLIHLEPNRSAKGIVETGGAYIVGNKAGMVLPGMRASSARLAPEVTLPG